MGGFLFEFQWPHHRICHRFRNIWYQIFMTLNYEGPWSSGVKVHSANRKPMVGFLSDVLSPTLSLSSISHRFRYTSPRNRKERTKKLEFTMQKLQHCTTLDLSWPLTVLNLLVLLFNAAQSEHQPFCHYTLASQTTHCETSRIATVG